MPISYRIDSKRHLVLTTASGVLTDDDILQLKERLVVDPEFQPGMKELADIRAIDRLAVTTGGVRRMMFHDQAHAPQVGGHQLAIVVSHGVAYGMARMYQMMTEETVAGVGIFRDVDAATSWLGISGEPACGPELPPPLS
jgi:hypothetical protein